MRVSAGDFHRFDSVRDLVAYCRAHYRTARVATRVTDDELLIEVEPAIGPCFCALVVHLEGERSYLVQLPPMATDQAPSLAS